MGVWKHLSLNGCRNLSSGSPTTKLWWRSSPGTTEHSRTSSKKALAPTGKQETVDYLVGEEHTPIRVTCEAIGLAGSTLLQETSRAKRVGSARDGCIKSGRASMVARALACAFPIYAIKTISGSDGFTTKGSPLWGQGDGTQLA